MFIISEIFIEKGLLHYVTLATKLLHVVLFHEDITQHDLHLLQLDLSHIDLTCPNMTFA